MTKRLKRKFFCADVDNVVGDPDVPVNVKEKSAELSQPGVDGGAITLQIEEPFEIRIGKNRIVAVADTRCRSIVDQVEIEPNESTFESSEPHCGCRWH